MLGWIPVIGPIIQGLFNTAASIYSKFKDTQLGMREQDVAEAKVSEQIIHDTNDDILLRLLRDLAILPVVVWSVLIGWDTIIGARHTDTGLLFHPWAADWMFVVSQYPANVAYLPYVVIVFLFGNIGMNIWKRK